MFDRAVVKLYPRIVALELMLDFYYYRHYLRSLEKFDKCIRNCESVVSVKTTSELWDHTRHEFEEVGYSSKGRLVSGLDWRAVILAILYTISAIILFISDGR